MESVKLVAVATVYFVSTVVILHIIRNQIMNSLANLQAAVALLTTVTASAEATISGLKTKLDAAIADGKLNNNSDALDALSKSIGDNIAGLTASITAGTAADPAAVPAEAEAAAALPVDPPADPSASTGDGGNVATAS